jgi:hypothetical protein
MHLRKVRVKLSPCFNLIKHYAMKAYGGVDVHIMYILLDLFILLEYNVPVQCRAEIKFALPLTIHI